MDVASPSVSLLRWLIETVFPPRCVLCAAPGLERMDLCAGCHRGLPWLGSTCRQCAIPLAGDDESRPRCGQCLQHPPAFDHSTSLFAYRDDAVKLIHQLKFNERLVNAHLLGSLLVEAVQQRGAALPDCIVPVPLHHRRLKHRGFNQSIELSRPAARILGIPIDYRAVIRVRDTHAQTGLDRVQRSGNLRGAFELARPLRASHVAIVDDVVTTTSTVNELARTLKKAGAERVDVWSIARAL